MRYSKDQILLMGEMDFHQAFYKKKVIVESKTEITRGIINLIKLANPDNLPFSICLNGKNINIVDIKNIEVL